jgi:phosphoribosylpyrophosphate synthetase
MDLIKQQINKETVIVFPDEWAKKRFSSEFTWFEIITCSKKRIWEKREITINDWDPKNKDMIIIDDLIQSWWTIIKTAQKLRELWAKSVDAFATHWVFVENSFELLAKNLDNLFTTDTIPENIKRAQNIENMEVLRINKMINKKIIEVV